MPISVDSNLTGLRFAEEVAGSIGTLAGTEVWYPLEPNSYGDFGPQVTTVARQPIVDDRQLNRGVVTDLDASAGFQMDMTLGDPMDSLLSGFFFAEWRRKAREDVTSVTATLYNMATSAGFAVDDLICGVNFDVAANNGLKKVTAVAATTVTAAGTATEAGPPSDARIVKVGIEAATGDVDVDASTDPTRPRLTSTLLDFTTQGFIVGEWIHIGGDAAGSFFTNSVNNGFCRIYSIAATELVFDKTQFTMVDETAAAVDLRLFYGDVLRNEPDATNIVKKSFQMERTLGAAGSVGWEYIVGCVANTLSVQANTADKVTVDVAFVATDSESREPPAVVKAGTRPDQKSETAFNTSSDFSRLRLVNAGDLTGITTYLTEMNFQINNNASPVKALCNLGAVDVTAGFFQVSGTVTALFSDIASIAAVRDNTEASLDMAFVKENEGLILDMVSVTLGDGRLNVEQNSPIKIPLSLDAARGSGVITHTLLAAQFCYLPDLAETYSC